MELFPGITYPTMTPLWFLQDDLLCGLETYLCKTLLITLGVSFTGTEFQALEIRTDSISCNSGAVVFPLSCLTTAHLLTTASPSFLTNCAQGPGRPCSARRSPPHPPAAHQWQPSRSTSPTVRLVSISPSTRHLEIFHDSYFPYSHCPSS